MRKSPNKTIHPPVGEGVVQLQVFNLPFQWSVSTVLPSSVSPSVSPTSVSGSAVSAVSSGIRSVSVSSGSVSVSRSVSVSVSESVSSVSVSVSVSTRSVSVSKSVSVSVSVSVSESNPVSPVSIGTIDSTRSMASPSRLSQLPIPPSLSIKRTQGTKEPSTP
jgi:hypothetical protein